MGAETAYRRFVTPAMERAITEATKRNLARQRAA